MFKVIETFHDAKTMELYTVGMVIDWEDEARIKAALDRKLIEEIKTEPKPKKAPAKKKTTK